MYTTLTFTTEAHHLVAYFCNLKSVTFKVKIMGDATMIIRLVSIMCYNFKATPITNNDYSFHIKAAELL